MNLTIHVIIPFLFNIYTSFCFSFEWTFYLLVSLNYSYELYI